MMWLVFRDGGVRKLLHGRNGREYSLPDLPHFSVNYFCPDTRTVYEFLGCYSHGHTCQPYRDVCTLRRDTLAERYERRMMRIEHITRTGYQVEIQWEWQFDEWDIVL